MTIHDIKRYAVSGDIAYPIHEDPEGDYVTYEDHVAAIEAEQYEPLTCDECGAETDDPWHTSHGENRHVHLCDACYEADHKRRGGDQQPFGYFRPEPFGWTDCAETDEGAIALYERPQERGEPVAYLDLGLGGYMDVGTDLTDEQLAALPKGRHMLAIIGTYGVAGYREVAPQSAEPVKVPSDAEAYALWTEIVAQHPTLARQVPEFARALLARCGQSAGSGGGNE